MRQFKALVIAVLLLAVIPATNAADEHRHWVKADFGLNFSHPLGDAKVTLAGDSTNLDVDDGVGYYGDVELGLSPRLGLKFAVQSNDYDVDVSSGDLAGKFTRVRDRAYIANLLYHFGERTSRVNFYVGGGFAYVNYDDLPLHDNFQRFFGCAHSFTCPNRTNRVSVRSDKTFNVEGGADIHFSDDAHWGLNIDARYIKTTPEERPVRAGGHRANPDLKLELDPITLGVGATYRW